MSDTTVQGSVLLVDEEVKAAVSEITGRPELYESGTVGVRLSGVSEMAGGKEMTAVDTLPLG